MFDFVYISYQVEGPSVEDRDSFFDNLIEAALSVSSDVITKECPRSVSLPELPKAPKVATGPKASELKAKFEAEQHALRRLRMCLRDICNRYTDLRLNSLIFPSFGVSTF